MIKMKKEFDVVCFGSAARDIHVKADDFATDEHSRAGLFLPFGYKIDVKEIKYTTGGGGTNAAATFATQGFETAFCGAIGADEAGLEIVRELKSLKIDLRFLAKSKESMTNHSVIISKGKEDRIILSYRGASEVMEKSMIPFEKIISKWFYIAPLSGLLCEADPESQKTPFEDIIDFAKGNNMQVAINPSKQQLSLPENHLLRIFQKADILFLNSQEASFLTKLPIEKEKEILEKVHQMFKGIFVMTKGGDGVVVSDGKYFYMAKPNPTRVVVDTTGAGDAFASGFVCEFMKQNGDVEKAIQFGLGNSEGNLREVGAKTGILKKDEEFKRVPITKTKIS